MTIETKEAAEGVSFGMNLIAIILGVATGVATIASFFGGGGLGAVAILGLASKLTEGVSEAMEILAKDPPRDDYHLVTRFSPAKFEPTIADDQMDPVWNRFNRAQIELHQAILALVTSFERLDGARSSLRQPRADAGLLVHRMTSQRQAIRYNAHAARQRIQTLLKLRRRINAAWLAEAGAIRARLGALSLETIQKEFAASWSRIEPDLLRMLGDAEHVTKIKTYVEKAAQSGLDIPDEILSDEWVKSMIRLDRRLSILAGELILTPQRYELEVRI